MAGRIGPYEIEDLLGRGALAAVYTASDSRDGRRVALKVVRKETVGLTEREHVLRRFRQGAEIAHRLQHSCIVSVHDWGEDEEVAWQAMELVLGAPLQTLAEPPVPLAERLGAVIRLLDAIAFFHQNGILLRDITPVNVLILGDGTIKVTELGQASQGGDDGVGAIGIPSYTAPEQLIGDPVDERADIFAAGAILFHLLTGRGPYPGSLAEVLQIHLSGRTPRAGACAPSVPPALCAAVARALSANPDDRFPSAAAFAETLAALRDSLPPPVVRPEGGPDMAVPEVLAGDDAVSLRMRVHLLLVRALEGDVTPYLTPLRETLSAFLAADDAAQRDRLAGVLVMAAEALQELILANAPVPGEPTTGRRPDWVDSVHLFDLVRVTLHKVGRGEAVEPMVRSVVRELRIIALLYVGQVNRLVFSADHIEMEGITANLMRLDILVWALEVLHDGEAVCDLRISGRMIAGQVLRKVSATLRGFADDPEELAARFDVANAVVAIEDLIVLADRVLEDDPEIAPDDKAYAKWLGRDIIFDLCDSARHLVAITANELATRIGAAGCDLRGFTGNMRQLGRLHRFAARVDDPLIRESLRQLAEESEEAIHSLAADTVAALVDVKDDDLPRQALLHGQLTAIQDVVQELGWLQFAQDLMGVLRHSLLERDAA